MAVLQKKTWNRSQSCEYNLHTLTSEFFQRDLRASEVNGYISVTKKTLFPTRNLYAKERFEAQQFFLQTSCGAVLSLGSSSENQLPIMNFVKLVSLDVIIYPGAYNFYTTNCCQLVYLETLEKNMRIVSI